MSKSRHADGSAKLKTPGGFNRLIPGWMLEANAKCYELSEQVHISPKAILSLIELLEGSIEELKLRGAPGCRLAERRGAVAGAVAGNAGGDGGGDQCPP